MSHLLFLNDGLSYSTGSVSDQIITDRSFKHISTGQAVQQYNRYDPALSTQQSYVQ